MSPGASRLVPALVVVVAVGTFAGCSIERVLNRRTGAAVAAPPREAQTLHARSRIVDLHADSLLWGRDLGVRSTTGHVDLPRLRAGNVAVQFFTLVTHVPMSIDLSRTDERWPDLVTLLALVQGWPRATWSSRLQRAELQIGRLEALARRDGRLRILHRRDDLRRLLEARREDPGWLGAVIGVEGAHALDGRASNLERLAARGLRMVGLVHFFDNEFAGSAHGRFKTGLTEEGRELVRRMEMRGVLVDLAHASEATIRDVLAMATRPTVVSHTGLRATCDNPRNLGDEQIRAIAAAGGIIGIGFWETAVCGETPADVARSIVHAVSVVGDRHVALGSDFDGAVATPFDAAGLDRLTAALLDAGLDESSIRRILGENALELLRTTLPG